MAKQQLPSCLAVLRSLHLTLGVLLLVVVSERQ